VDAVPGADFNHAAVIKRIRVNEHGLRLSAREHFFEVWKEQARVQVIARRVLRGEGMIRFRDAYDFNLWIVQRMIEKSLDVAMDQANNANPKRHLIFRPRGLTLEISG
jgi:hypothetical protein